jgi:iron-sulfur cluster assembly protein
MLKITENAANQIKEQIKQSKADEEGLILRIAAKTNQDGSFEYGMGFDEPREDDAKTNQYDIDIVIDPKSLELLEEATMDFDQLEDGQVGFIFMNPFDPNYNPPKKQK